MSKVVKRFPIIQKILVLVQSDKLFQINTFHIQTTYSDVVFLEEVFHDIMIL